MPALRLRSILGARHGPESVFSGPRVRIGRSRDNDFILPDKSEPLSGGHHAEALLDSSGTWWIVDCHSTNGTFVNGARADRQAIKNGDRITFGDEAFVVAIGGVRPAAVLGAMLVLLILAAGVVFGLFEHQPRITPIDATDASRFERIASEAVPSVFFVALEEGGQRTPLGTAFAVQISPSTFALATNAHIAAAIAGRGALANDSPIHAVAVRGDANAAQAIVAVRIDPAWHAGSIEQDVALLELAPGAALRPLPIANADSLSRIIRGTEIAAFGFPAVSTDAAHPRGRLSMDVVGDVRGDYFESGLGISPGTSGSPVFDLSGSVVGIVAGGDFVDAPGEHLKPSGSAANWVLSAAVLRDILK